ncbi:MAG: Ldh family oxidoreductase [Chloroflexi bacterium]|nr:Ldh family oxidoreductase [Chloroflexota bacterium]
MERITVSLAALREVGVALFVDAGLSREHAETIVRVQTEADLRGMHSHGMRAVPAYVKRIELGIINRRANPRVVSEAGAAAVVDGDAGPGQVVASMAMEICVARAKAHGIGAVAVRNSNHFGAAGYYAMMALPDLIGFATTNGNLFMAPAGGTAPVVGNNPIAYAIPTAEEPPIVLDVATSVVAGGKIELAAAEGDALPTGWALDAEGNPTAELSKALAGLGVPLGAPLAGHKGFGLALAMEALAAGLSGARIGQEHTVEVERGPRPWDEGHFFLAIDPSLFTPLPEFKRRTDQLVREVRSSPPASAADRVRAPGDLGWARRERGLQDGIPMPASIVRHLRDLAAARGILMDGVSG